MNISAHVTAAIDDANGGKFESALMHALVTIDRSSKRLFPELARPGKVGARYVRCLRDYYWLIEPMIGAGLNLVETRFENVPLAKNRVPDLAEIVYEVFRCNHVHGDDPPAGFSLISASGPYGSVWLLGDGELHMPDRLLWALLSVAVMARPNGVEQSSGTYYLSLGEEKFPIAEWWGREDNFRAVAARYNTVRVKLQGLSFTANP